MIGQTLCNKTVRAALFGRVIKKEILDTSDKAVAFYKLQIEAAKKAVVSWSLVGKRLGVVKDVRIMIGKLIWADRELALYDITNESKDWDLGVQTRTEHESD